MPSSRRNAREAPRKDEPDNIDPPIPNSATEEWRRRELATVGLGATAGFLGTIVDTARGWVDGSALTMPGYRDRIVTVYHTREQGGMNLDMHEEVIDRLTNRGLAAAEALIARFVGAAPTATGATAWNEHRWVRFRTAAASLERWLRRFHDVYCADARPFETAFPDWLDPDASRRPAGVRVVARSGRRRTHPHRRAGRSRRAVGGTGLRFRVGGGTDAESRAAQPAPAVTAALFFSLP